MADLGGGHSRPVPPLLKHFSINAPPFCRCAPPFETKQKKTKKKKKVSDSARLYPGCYLPPPPPDVDGAPKKKSVGVPPPPPPPLISFFGTCASLDAGGGPKKNSMLCPPFLKFLDPPVIVSDYWGRIKRYCTRFNKILNQWLTYKRYNNLSATVHFDERHNIIHHYNFFLHLLVKYDSSLDIPFLRNRRMSGEKCVKGVGPLLETCSN